MKTCDNLAFTLIFSIPYFYYTAPFAFSPCQLHQLLCVAPHAILCYVYHKILTMNKSDFSLYSKSFANQNFSLYMLQQAI